MMSILLHPRSAHAVRATRLLPSTHHKAHLPSFSSPFPSTHPNSHPGHVQRRSIHIIQAAQDVIITLHSVTGTPWALTIPLVAVGVNLFFRFPFTLYTQRILQRQHLALPVLQARSSRFLRNVRDAPLSREKMVALGKARLGEENDRIFSAIGAQRWKLYSSWAGVPFWLLGAEGIRRLCGASKGILGMLMGDYAPAAAAAAPPGPDDAGGSLTTSTSSPVPVLGISETAPTGESAFSSDAMAVSDMASNAAHGLATEGMLWFTDLTVPDPQLILPFAVSAMMFVSILSTNSDAYRRLVKMLSKDSGLVEDDITLPKPDRRGFLRKCLLVLSVAIGPLTLHLPAAIHLYWLTSTATHLSLRLWLDTRMPPRKSETLCQRFETGFIRPKIIKRGPAEIITGNAGEYKR